MNATLQKIVFGLFVTFSCTLAQENSYSFALDSVDAHVMLKLQTVAPVPCLGTTIRTEIRQAGDTVIIFPTGFIRPTPCLDGVSPASARISLGRQTRASFVLSIREDGAEDLWIVSRTGEGFHVAPVRQSFTSYSK